MLDRFFGLGAVVIACAAAIPAQTISISSPIPWVTQRNDSITFRAQIDTSQIKERSIAIKLIQISNGKKKELVSKNVQFQDVSVDFSFGQIKKSLVGGDEYLQVEWSIPKTSERGVIEPIGIVSESNFTGLTKVTAAKVGSVNDVASAVAQKFSKIGDVQFATAWNKENLFIAVKKDAQSKSVVKFALDGKNGKAAFLSYPDRVIEFSSANDSIAPIHYTRGIANNILSYNKTAWKAGITLQKSGDISVIVVPWYETGIVPFDDRTVGFGLIAESYDGKVIEAIPAAAKANIPGTWTDILLSK